MMDSVPAHELKFLALFVSTRLLPPIVVLIRLWVREIKHAAFQFSRACGRHASRNMFHEYLLTEPLDVREQVKATAGYVRPPQGPATGNWDRA
ncbi:MAG: hypothetical protein GY758_26545 [Fuerstiella sp.]|nr:hypothetical protein [Fuerstiella sp.]MCP4505701.1 hypothetical protein [Fuerstiella sp.]